MSRNHKLGAGQAGLTQTHRTVVSLETWKAHKVARSGTELIANADVATLANASESSMGEGAPPLDATQFGADGAAAKDAETALRPRFDPSLMPAPSASTKRFMEVMSGDESDPAFAVGAVLFFWRYSRRGLPMPKRAMALLERHAAAGDATCILVRDWLQKKMVTTGKRTLWAFEGGKS